MSTTVLGISAYYHDAAAALLRDGKIVAAAFDKHNLYIGEFFRHGIHRFQVHGAVLPDGSVGTAAGFYTHDTLGGQSGVFN